MPVPELGDLEPVSVREIWEHEARDFTPWLAENLDRLGVELGMNLDLVETEASTGPFYLDILARETDLEVNVAIENQLEGSDHGHLGQLLTYAAGHDARILIWVALRFDDAHREALAYLNRLLPGQLEIYGVEIRAWRIGDRCERRISVRWYPPKQGLSGRRPTCRREGPRHRIGSRYSIDL